MQTTNNGAQAYSAGGIKLGGIITDAVSFKNATNSTVAFEITNAAGIGNNFVVDTVNSRVNINTGGYGANLNMGGTSTFRTTTNSATGFQIQNSAGDALFVADTLSATNQIANPDFESNTTNWANITGGTITRQTTLVNTYQGVASAQIVTTATAGAGVRTTGFDATQAANTYTLSFYAKVAGGTFSTLVAGYNQGASDVPCTLNSTTVLTTGFQRYTCTFTTTANLASIYVSQSDATARTIYIDSFQLQTGSAATPFQFGGIQLRGIIGSPVSIQASSNSTTAVQIQDSSGTSNLFVADTLNNRIGIGLKPEWGTLSVGQTSMAGQDAVLVSGTSSSTSLATDYGHLNLHNSNTTDGNYASLYFSTLSSTGGLVYPVAIQGVFTNHAAGLTAGDLVFSTRASGASTTEKLRITGAGDLQVLGATVITSARVLQNVTTDTSILTAGTLGVARGGTGFASATLNGLVYGNGTGVLQVTAAGTGGQVLLANATGVPTFMTLSGDITISNTGVTAIGVGKVTSSMILDSTIVNGDLSIGTFGNITGTGALSAGSIASGFGTILTGNTITGTSLNGTTGINTGAGAGTQRIDASGNLLNIANFSSTGTIQASGTTGSSYIMSALGLGTTSPQAATISALTIANNRWISGVDAAGTGFVNMFAVNAQNQIQVGAALSIDGSIVLPTNGGQLTLVDMGIDSTAALGTKQSYTMRVGSTNALTVYSEADGAGNAQNVRVAIGSSITPAYTLDVGGDINSSTALRVGGIQVCTSSGCTAAGGVTLQATTPGTADTGNFNITGTGITGTALLSPRLDTASAGALTLGNTTATSITLGKTSGSTNIATTINGTAQFKNNSDSATSFQIQNAAASTMLTMDTTNGKLTVNQGGLNVNGLANPSNITLSSAATGGTLAAATYYYRVSATGPAGETQALLGTPVSVTTSGTTSVNTFSWNAVTYATGYKVYRTTDAGATWFVNTLGSGATSLVDNGSTYAWATSGSPNIYTNNTGEVRLTTGANLWFDTASTQSIRGSYSDLIIGAGTAGGVLVQANAFVVQDTTGYNTNLYMSNTGATTFKNRVDSTASFQVQNSAGTNLFSTDTTNTRIQVGSSTTDTTAVLLTLDSSSNAADPTGVNGAMYYSTAKNRFRCYQNGAWKNCETATYLRLAADASNSTTGYQAISDLSWGVEAGTDYSFECNLMISSAATTTGFYSLIGDTGTAYTGTMSVNIQIPNANGNNVTVYGLGTGVNAGYGNATNSSGATPILHNLKGIAGPTSTTTIGPKFRSGVASSAVTVHKGSWCTIF